MTKVRVIKMVGRMISNKEDPYNGDFLFSGAALFRLPYLGGKFVM